MATEPRTDESTDERIVAFVVYPGLTLLDLVGPLQVLTNLGAPYRTLTVGERVETMPTDTGLGIVPEATFAEAPHPYAIVVPGGGRGTIRAMATPAVQDYLRAADETAEVVTSVCTGALVLAAAGLLEGRDATTHWGFADYLNRLGTRYQRARWVEDGKYITAAGVSAGIDMALFLAARLTNEDRAQRIQAGIEYDPQPPFGPMDWNRADVAAYWSSMPTAEQRRAYFTPLLEGRPDLLEQFLA
jgi:transcriptional regulator GlxA family with amidase domain